ncbi:UNC93-like protein 3 [Diplonema papillatum]|nr:UNC93-like protein 3 [Diplonema papillatum]
MGEEFVYKRNLYVISISFFCLFTAFSTIQNLETSIVAGTCHDCDEYCWAGNPLCVDVHQSGSLSKNDAVCSWTEGAVKYCSKYGGECKSTCPNTDDGWTVVVNETLTPAFDDCSGSSNVGAIALGTLYLTFTAFCLTGPYVVRLLKPKWSIAVAFVIFSLFCCANLLVAQFPSVKAMQWGVLLPASAFVGIAASFMWTAHGAYISIIASKYAAALDMDADTVVGTHLFFFLIVHLY